MKKRDTLGAFGLSMWLDIIYIDAKNVDIKDSNFNFKERCTGEFSFRDSTIKVLKKYKFSDDSLIKVVLLRHCDRNIIGVVRYFKDGAYRVLAKGYASWLVDNHGNLRHLTVSDALGALPSDTLVKYYNFVNCKRVYPLHIHLRRLQEFGVLFDDTGKGYVSLKGLNLRKLLTKELADRWVKDERN